MTLVCHGPAVGPLTHVDLPGRAQAVREDYLGDTVLVLYHRSNVVQRQETVTFDLSRGILALSAAGQQLHQFYVVPGRQLWKLYISKEHNTVSETKYL